MQSRIAVLWLPLLVAGVCLPAEEPPAAGQVTSTKLDMEATLYNDKAAIRSALGQELPDGVMVVAVRLVPKGDAPVKIWRSEFFLRSDKDGQRSEPYEPTQMAGGSVMSIGKVQQTTGTIMVQDQGPIWGGVGGARPRRMGGDGSGIGNPSTSGVETNEVRTTETKGETDNKLLTLLKEKVLPEGEISEPVSGLLYFPIEGKHKVKQMELHYRGEAAKLDLRFLKKNK